MPTTQVYTEVGQAAILDLQRQDGKRPVYKWGGRTGRCLTQRQAETWLRSGGRFSLVPYSIGFSVLDIDAGPWQDLAAVYPPHAVIPSRKMWRRHLYYPDHEGRPNANGRQLHGCHVDVRSASGYVALWQPEAVQEAAERPRQGGPIPLVDDLAGEGRSGTAKTTREPARAATRESTEGRPTERRLPWHAMGPASRSGESVGLHPRQRVQRPRPVPHRNPPVRRDAGQRDARPNRLLGRHHKRPREVRLLRRAIRMAKVAAGPRE